VILVAVVPAEGAAAWVRVMRATRNAAAMDLERERIRVRLWNVATGPAGYEGTTEK
jgi:hypothetical protein